MIFNAVQKAEGNSMSLVDHVETPIVRPPHVLAPLIRQDLAEAEMAAETAASPYWLAAGQKLNEAKSQIAHGEFNPWIKRNFSISLEQARRYMKAADATTDTQNGRTRTFSSLNEALREVGDSSAASGRPRPQAWHEPVKEVLDRVNVNKLAEEQLKRQAEKDLQRKLALQLIDIGYKALASKLHPDKGGSKEAMGRLNQVRDRLKAAVQ